MKEPNLNKTSKLRKQLDGAEAQAQHVLNEEYRQHINQAVQQGWVNIEQGDLHKAKSNLYEARHYFDKARYEDSVIFYSTPLAITYSVFYLILFSSIIILAPKITQTTESIFVSPLLIAIAGGGIGGTTAVLSKIVGIRLKTQAITSRITWYGIKPILGAIMGTVTYIAILAGLTIFTESMIVNNLTGVFLTGFLGGYLESFSTRVLNELAEKMEETSN